MEIDDFPRQPFHVRDAKRLGCSHRSVRRAAEDGLLVRVMRGVYRRSDVPDTVETRAAAARCVISSHHVAVDRTAAWLLGVDMLTLHEHELIPPLEVCALRGRNPTHRPELDGRSRDLSPSDVTRVGDVRVTTPLRTSLDLGCHLRRREAFAAMCLLARQHGLTAGDLVCELPRYRRRRGVVQCRQLARHVEPRVESHREAWTLLEIIDAGLPAPEPQWWVERDGVPAFRLDFAYVAARVCVEYDGAEAHDRTPGQREHDRQRRAWLQDDGWDVIVVRRGDFTGVGLGRWLEALREALRPSYTNRRW